MWLCRRLVAQVRQMQDEADRAWDYARDLSEASGAPYKDRDGTWRNLKGDVSMTGIALRHWCERKGVRFS